MFVSFQPLHKRWHGQAKDKRLITLKQTRSFIQIWSSGCQYVFTYFCQCLFTYFIEQMENTE